MEANQNEHLVGKFVIVKDLQFSDFMKNEKDEIMIFDTEDEALSLCGMYEFENVLVLKVVNNFVEPQEVQKPQEVPKVKIKRSEITSENKVWVRLGDVLVSDNFRSWDEMCKKHGLSEWCLNEGTADYEDTILISVEDAEKWQLIELE